MRCDFLEKFIAEKLGNNILDENSATPESAEPVVEIENDLNILRSDSSCGVVYDKGDTLIQLGDEQEFRGVALRNGAQLLDTAGDCKDLDFRTNVKTDVT